MITIENDFIKASFLTKGAEWRSLVEKNQGQEFLWQADPAYWAKSSPVLFPFVGSLKDGAYEYQGQSYSMGRHGFARDQEFRVKEQEPWRVVFVLESGDASRAVYPFDWSLEIEYRVWKRVVQIAYRVINRGTVDLLFSLGAHPAFQMPIVPGGRFEDGTLDFEAAEPLERWMLDAKGLLSGERRLVPTEGQSLALSRDLFSEDAVIFKGLKSNRVRLRQQGSAWGLNLEFSGFPYLGIWSAPKAPFVCIEPWCGITDSTVSTGRLEDKEGIERLAAGQIFQRSFSVTVER